MEYPSLSLQGINGIIFHFSPATYSLILILVVVNI